MGKKKEKGFISSREHSYSAGLQRFISVDGMLYACQMSRKNARLYQYSDVISQACSEFFRYRNGVVYAHDGRVWVPLSEGVLRKVVRDAFVGAAEKIGVYMGDVVKGDWVDREKKIMEYAISGAQESRLDYDPSIVGFVNGVWDFSDIDHPVCHSFSDRLSVTELLPYSYDADASCPLWVSFVSSMLPRRDVLKLQKFFGLGCVDRKLMGKSVEESLWLIGDGANGKSTIQQVMRGVFGEWNVGSTRLDALLDRNVDARMRAVAAIEGKIFNMCDEISGTDIEKGSDMFKSLVSGSPQDARSLSKDIWTAEDIPFFVFSMNQKPVHKKMDDAFRRRMVTIDFRSSVKAEDMDRGLSAKLAREYAGIRNWAMEGYKLLVRDNYSVRGYGEVSDSDTEMMIASGLTVDVWKDYEKISASRHVGHDKDEVRSEVKFQDLYGDYSSFCSHKLLCQPVTQNQFGRDLQRLHFESKRGAGGMYYYLYCDIKHRYNTK